MQSPSLEARHVPAFPPPLLTSSTSTDGTNEDPQHSPTSSSTSPSHPAGSDDIPEPLMSSRSGDEEEEKVSDGVELAGGVIDD